MPNHEEAQESPLWAALRFGGLAGITGLAVGGTIGVLRSPTPGLWATVSGLQWALLGGTYWGIRTTFLQSQLQEDITPRMKTHASAGSGALSFAVVGAVTRGRRNVIPGTIMGTMLGFTGQSLYNVMDARHTQSVMTGVGKAPWWHRAMNSSWSPVKRLSDDDYAKMLEEKLVRVEADIAILDDEIAKFKEEQHSNAVGHISGEDEP